MITPKEKFEKTLKMDLNAMNVKGSALLEYIKNPRWRFIYLLRRTELYFALRNKSVFHKFRYIVAFYVYKKLGLRLGFTIPINVCGPGLCLPHYGTIVISKLARIGQNAKIHVCVNIGETDGAAPVIGDNVYIGPGAKLFGNIFLGNNVSVGANAVVNKSFDEDGIVIVGVPAKIVKRESSH